MDSLTHTVLGACIGEALAGKKIGKQAMFWGALSNNIPDIDVVTSGWMSQADSLLAHRGFTHSILFAIVFPAILAFLFSRWHKSPHMLFRNWYIMFASGMFVHIFIDALTCYGTGWFEPFSHHRVTMNVLFVADPFYTITLLISFFVLLIIKAKKHSRRTWTRFGLGISTIYMAYAFINKIVIDNEFKHELQKENISYSNYFTTPAPLNNFLWYLVAKNDTGYYIGYHTFLNSKKDIQLTYRPSKENLISELPQDNDLQKLIRFSKGYYAADISDDTLYFYDIRFGSVGGWEDPNAEFVFKYSLAKNANNDLVIQRGRFKPINGSVFKSLYRGICGY